MSKEPRIILQDLPTTVKAFSYQDDEGNPCVAVNSNIPKAVQVEACQHEFGPSQSAPGMIKSRL